MTRPPVALRVARLVALAAAAVVLLAGCSAGQDAVASTGEFQLVAPGGQVTRFGPMVTPEDEGLVQAVESALPG